MSTDQPSVPAEPAEKKKRRWPAALDDRARRVKVATAGAGAALIALLAILNGTLDLWDKISGENGEKAVATLDVQQELRTDVPWGDYVNVHPEASTQDSYTEHQLGWFGEEYRVVLQVDNRSGKRAELSWEVFQPPGTQLTLPAWAPHELEGQVGADGRIDFRPWVAVPEGAGEFYPKFTLTMEDTTLPPATTGPTLTIGRN